MSVRECALRVVDIVCVRARFFFVLVGVCVCDGHPTRQAQAGRKAERQALTEIPKNSDTRVAHAHFPRGKQILRLCCH